MSNRDEQGLPSDAGQRIALRPSEAAAALGISQRTLWSLTSQGVVPHVRLNTAVRYPVDALREWANDRAREVSDEAC